MLQSRLLTARPWRASSESSPASSGPSTMSDDDVHRALIVFLRDEHDFSFRCQHAVALVNGLRHLGKERAISLLRQFLKEMNGNNERESAVAFICRLLFIAPEGGWPPVNPGVPSPTFDAQVAAKRFPQFPLAVSDGVPFFLLWAYTNNGGVSKTLRPRARRHLRMSRFGLDSAGSCHRRF